MTNTILDFIKNEVYTDQYNITEIDIMNFKSISDSNKKILQLIIKGYDINEISLIMGIKKETLVKRLYRLRSNYEIKKYFKR